MVGLLSLIICAFIAVLGAFNHPPSLLAASLSSLLCILEVILKFGYGNPVAFCWQGSWYQSAKANGWWVTRIQVACCGCTSSSLVDDRPRQVIDRHLLVYV